MSILVNNYQEFLTTQYSSQGHSWANEPNGPYGSRAQLGQWAQQVPGPNRFQVQLNQWAQMGPVTKYAQMGPGLESIMGDGEAANIAKT